MSAQQIAADTWERAFNYGLPTFILLGLGWITVRYVIPRIDKWVEQSRIERLEERKQFAALQQEQTSAMREQAHAMREQATTMQQQASTMSEIARLLQQVREDQEKRNRNAREGGGDWRR